MCIVRMTVKVKRMACVEVYCMGMEAIATTYVCTLHMYFCAFADCSGGSDVQAS